MMFASKEIPNVVLRSNIFSSFFYLAPVSLTNVLSDDRIDLKSENKSWEVRVIK